MIGQSTSQVPLSPLGVSRTDFPLSCHRDLEKTLQDLAKTNASATEEPPKYPELDTGKVQRILDETLGYL